MAEAMGPDQSPVLDRGALEQLRALQRPGRPCILSRVIALFQKDAPQHLEVMRTAAGIGAHAELFRAAHTLKSNAANLGAHRLRYVCAAIEQGARTGELDGLDAWLEELETSLETALAALAGELER